MSGQRETKSPAFIGLSFGSAAAFAVAVLCGPGRLLLALVLLAVIVGVTGWVSELLVALSVAGVAWFSFVGSVVVGDAELRVDGRTLVYLLAFGVVAVAGYLAAAVAARWPRRLGVLDGPALSQDQSLARCAAPVSLLDLSAAVPSPRGIPDQERLDV
jgi:hypothetical protein